MRLRSAVPLGLILASVGMIGQTPVKSVAGPDPKTESASLSDHDKNIEAYIELIRMDLRKEKAQVTGAVLQLDGNEAAKFWPIYKNFEAELTQVYDVVVALVTDYAANYDKMTPDLADQLATKLLALEQQRNDLKRKYYRQFKGPSTRSSLLGSSKLKTRSNDYSTCRSHPGSPSLAETSHEASRHSYPTLFDRGTRSSPLTKRRASGP